MYFAGMKVSSVLGAVLLATVHAFAPKSSGGLTEITDTATFNAFRANSPALVVEFFSTWCGPCKALAPTLASAATSHPDIKFIKVDVDQFPALANEFGVTMLPTTLYMRRGQVVNRFTGAKPASGVATFINDSKNSRK